MGLRHAPAAKGSLCEGAKGSVKRVNQPALASLLLCKCFLFPSRWESKNLPPPCRMNQDHNAELCLTHTCAHPHTQGVLGNLTSFYFFHALLPLLLLPGLSSSLHSSLHPSEFS